MVKRLFRVPKLVVGVYGLAYCLLEGRTLIRFLSDDGLRSATFSGMGKLNYCDWFSKWVAASRNSIRGSSCAV